MPSYKTTGRSMSPFILPGSELFVHPVEIAKIRKGDVICYVGQSSGGVAHRVVGKTRTEKGVALVTRGDAQNVEETVPEEAVLYVVHRVEHSYFSYRTNGVVGRVFARISLGESLSMRATRSAIRRTWRTLLRVRRKVSLSTAARF